MKSWCLIFSIDLCQIWTQCCVNLNCDSIFFVLFSKICLILNWTLHFPLTFFFILYIRKLFLLLNKLFKIQKSIRVFYYWFTKPKSKSSFNSWSKNVLYCTAHKLWGTYSPVLGTLHKIKIISFSFYVSIIF